MPSRPRGGGAGVVPRILYARTDVTTTLDGALMAGATELTLASVDGIYTGMRFGCAHQTSAYTAADVTAVDTAASTITISPGLTADLAHRSAVFVTPMWDTGDTLDLPAGPWREIALQCGWEIRSPNAANSWGHGYSLGEWIAPGHAWTHVQTDRNQWSWHDEPEPGADSYTIALIPDDVTQANNYFVLNYLPAGGPDGRPRLELAGLDDGSHTYLPRVRALRVVGRR